MKASVEGTPSSQETAQAHPDPRCDGGAASPPDRLQGDHRGNADGIPHPGSNQRGMRKEREGTNGWRHPEPARELRPDGEGRTLKGTKTHGRIGRSNFSNGAERNGLAGG